MEHHQTAVFQLGSTVANRKIQALHHGWGRGTGAAERGLITSRNWAPEGYPGNRHSPRHSPRRCLNFSKLTHLFTPVGWWHPWIFNAGSHLHWEHGAWPWDLGWEGWFDQEGCSRDRRTRSGPASLALEMVWCKLLTTDIFQYMRCFLFFMGRIIVFLILLMSTSSLSFRFFWALKPIKKDLKISQVSKHLHSLVLHITGWVTSVPRLGCLGFPNFGYLGPQDHVPEVKVLTTLGMFAVPVTAETTVGEIRQKVQELLPAGWKIPEHLETISLKPSEAWDGWDWLPGYQYLGVAGLAFNVIYFWPDFLLCSKKSCLWMILDELSQKFLLVVVRLQTATRHEAHRLASGMETRVLAGADWVGLQGPHVSVAVKCMSLFIFI